MITPQKPITIQASQVTPSQKFFGMFVGRSSSGKSVAELSFPKGILVFDTDIRKGYLDPNVKKFLDISSGTTFKIMPPKKTNFKVIEDELNALESLFNANQKPYSTLIFDSLGSLARLLTNEGRALLGGGMNKGGLQLSGPADYKFTTQAMYEIFDFLKTMPCNVIVSAHVQPRWGKPSGSKEDQFKEEVEIGERLAGVSANLGESILGYFDEIYLFSKDDNGSKHYVEFYSDIARSVLGLPRGKHEITGKLFYPWWLEQVQKAQGAAVAAS